MQPLGSYFILFHTRKTKLWRLHFTENKKQLKKVIKVTVEFAAGSTIQQPLVLGRTWWDQGILYCFYLSIKKHMKKNPQNNSDSSESCKVSYCCISRHSYLYKKMDFSFICIIEQKNFKIMATLLKYCFTHPLISKNTTKQRSFKNLLGAAYTECQAFSLC